MRSFSLTWSTTCTHVASATHTVLVRAGCTLIVLKGVTHALRCRPSGAAGVLYAAQMPTMALSNQNCIAVARRLDAIVRAPTGMGARHRPRCLTPQHQPRRIGFDMGR